MHIIKRPNDKAKSLSRRRNEAAIGERARNGYAENAGWVNWLGLRESESNDLGLNTNPIKYAAR